MQPLYSLCRLEVACGHIWLLLRAEVLQAEDFGQFQVAGLTWMTSQAESQPTKGESQRSDVIFQFHRAKVF